MLEVTLTISNGQAEQAIAHEHARHSAQRLASGLPPLTLAQFLAAWIVQESLRNARNARMQRVQAIARELASADDDTLAAVEAAAKLDAR